MAEVIAVHPVLNVRDVPLSVEWFQQLGFELAFFDRPTEPQYAAIRRDGVEIHLQWHSAEEWISGVQGNVYRFLVDDPDTLSTEFPSDVTGGRGAHDSAWGTREFGLYDPDGNALFFYRDR